MEHAAYQVVATSVATALTMPLDVIVTKAQAGQGRLARDIVRSVIASKGIVGLWHGMGWTALAKGSWWGGYRLCHSGLTSLGVSDSSSLMLASVVPTAMSNILWSLKSKKQVADEQLKQAAAALRSTSSMSEMLQLARKSAPFLWQGYPAALTMSMSDAFSVGCNAFLLNRWKTKDNAVWFVPLAGFLSDIPGTAITYPIRVVKTQRQASNLSLSFVGETRLTASMIGKVYLEAVRNPRNVFAGVGLQVLKGGVSKSINFSVLYLLVSTPTPTPPRPS